MNLDQRIELILDLTRRIADDLLATARRNRRVTDTEGCVVGLEQAKPDAMMVL